MTTLPKSAPTMLVLTNGNYFARINLEGEGEAGRERPTDGKSYFSNPHGEDLRRLRKCSHLLIRFSELWAALKETPRSHGAGD